jgi:hypothetical protein
MEFDKLHIRIREDEGFQAQMITYIESIISKSVDVAATRAFGELSITGLEGDNRS